MRKDKDPYPYVTAIKWLYNKLKELEENRNG